MEWLERIQPDVGFLIVGHGTRRGSGVAQLLQLTQRMGELAPQVPIEASFLELAEPTIIEGMKRLQNRGVRRVLAIPILLFEAGHAKTDIPDAVNDAAKELRMTVLGQTIPLGTHESVLKLSAARFDSAMQCTHFFGCLRAGGCERVVECQMTNHPALTGASSVDAFFPSPTMRLGLAMVGRGTSDEAALASMRNFSKLRWERSNLPIAWCNTGFFAGGRPTVDELLEEASRTDVETVVVQPHLLFEGELLEQLRGKVDILRGQFTEKKWLVGLPLGSDVALAAVFLDLAAEKIREIEPSGDH